MSFAFGVWPIGVYWGWTSLVHVIDTKKRTSARVHDGNFMDSVRVEYSVAGGTSTYKLYRIFCTYLSVYSIIRL